jgi:hypothetical protein
VSEFVQQFVPQVNAQNTPSLRKNSVKSAVLGVYLCDGYE